MSTPIERWIEALRSGKYKQSSMRLRSPEGYCCLGVACDLYAKETGASWIHTADGTYALDINPDEDAVLPAAVVDWLGVPRSNPFVRGGRTLASLNDDGVSFSEIADLIEQEFLNDNA